MQIIGEEGTHGPGNPNARRKDTGRSMTSWALRGVLGSRSPATTGFSECTLSRSPWHAENIPDGTIHTLGAGCTVTTLPEQCPRRRNGEHKLPTLASTRFGNDDSCHQCRPSQPSSGAPGNCSILPHRWVVGNCPAGCMA